MSDKEIESTAKSTAQLMDEIQEESHRYIEYIKEKKPDAEYFDAFAIWLFHRLALIETRLAIQAQGSAIENRLARIERQLEKVNINLTSGAIGG